jgi:hypothetical protein
MKLNKMCLLKDVFIVDDGKANISYILQIFELRYESATRGLRPMECE